jgi:hypothetical protein
MSEDTRRFDHERRQMHGLEVSEKTLCCGLVNVGKPDRGSDRVTKRE